MRKFSLSILTLAVGIGIGLTVAGRQGRVEPVFATVILGRA
jgi:uncharacterized protein HemY